jgi:hypothetical protein
MSKSSGVWWRESKRAYYTTLNDKQVRLSKDETEAREKFAALAKKASMPGDTSGAEEVVDEYLEHAKEKKTYRKHLLWPL